MGDHVVPLVERSMVNPVSLLEVSSQVSVIVVRETGTTVRLVGADGGSPGTVMDAGADGAEVPSVFAALTR